MIMQREAADSVHGHGLSVSRNGRGWSMQTAAPGPGISCTSGCVTVRTMSDASGLLLCAGKSGHGCV